MDPIKQNVYMARVAEQAERYSEMVEYIKKVATTPKGDDKKYTLSVEERNLLSVAYKNVVGSRRASWRVLSSLEQKEEYKKNTELAQQIKAFRGKVEEELTSTCNDILNILNEKLIPGSQNVDDKVFYLKMAGDYYRYLAEFQTGPEGEAATTGAKNSYASRSPAHPLVTRRPWKRVRRMVSLPPAPSFWVLLSTTLCSTMRS